MPACMSCSISSPWSLPLAATCEKMTPMSLNPTPAICAASPTVPRTCWSWVPDWMPLATRVAATLAASPSPNAVPCTLFKASSMIASTLCVSCPRALSLVWARSMFNARSNPPLAARAASPPPIVPIAARPTLPTLLNAPPTLLRMVLPPDLDADCTAVFNGSSMALPNPLVEGWMRMYPVPRSCAIDDHRPFSRRVRAAP